MRTRKKQPPSRWEPGMLRFAFICSPYRGDEEANTARAIELGKMALDMGYVPLIPHLHFPRFLDDANPKEREMGIKAGLWWLQSSDIIIIDTRTGISDGMMREFQFAVDTRKPKYFICHNCGKLGKNSQPIQTHLKRGAFFRPVFTCSRKCCDEWDRNHSKRKKVLVQCSNCGIEFKKDWQQYKLYSRLHFCKRECLLAYYSKKAAENAIVSPQEYWGWSHRRQMRAYQNRKKRNELGTAIGAD